MFNLSSAFSESSGFHLLRIVRFEAPDAQTAYSEAIRFGSVTAIWRTRGSERSSDGLIDFIAVSCQTVGQVVQGKEPVQLPRHRSSSLSEKCIGSSSDWKNISPLKFKKVLIAALGVKERIAHFDVTTLAG